MGGGVKKTLLDEMAFSLTMKGKRASNAGRRCVAVSVPSTLPLRRRTDAWVGQIQGY